MEEIHFDISRKVYSQEEFDKEYRYERPAKTWRSFLEGHISKFNFWEQSKIWFPFLDWIPKYRANCLIPDILAGFTVAIMNVPQGMFALAALMVGNVVNREIPHETIANLTEDTPLADRPDVQLVVTLTFLVGCVMVVMCLLQIHVFASYLSDSLISGFTTAAGIHVLLSQIPLLLGLTGIKERSGFLKVYYTLYDIFSHISRTNLAVLVLSGICVIALYIGKNYMNPEIKKRLCSLPVPLELITVVITTVLSQFCHFESKYNMVIVDKIETG
uniref:SLC26A/SulP transporter domain-containing protein n=1 Tax=Panagrolaimus davidi TaxID=227884 RepID=A0A914QZ37_9BILA